MEPPLKYTSYPATPVLSVDGVQLKFTAVCPTALAASPVGTDGGVVSLGGGVGWALEAPVVPKSCVQKIKPLLARATPAPIVVQAGFSMFALWPASLSQAVITDWAST